MYEKDAGQMFLTMGERIEESTELIVASDDTKHLREYIDILSETMECRELCKYTSEDAFGIDPDINITKEKLMFYDFTPFDKGIRNVICSC